MKSNGPIIRYSEAFKHQVLQEIESGDLTFSSARHKYGIGGPNTIQSWAKKYGNFGILPKLIRVESPKERDQIKSLKDEIKQLKNALADVTLDRVIAESTLKVICDQRGLDVEEVKKKSWFTIGREAKNQGQKVSRICHKLNKSRAAFYKQEDACLRQELDGRILRELTLEKRKPMPRLGGKKTFHEIKAELLQMGISIGRDRYFKWLKAENLLIRPKKRFARTTNSFHHYRKYDNKIKDLVVTRPDQVWVSDITYLRLQKGFCYLALITDVFSRKIVGYNVSNTLEVKGALKALGEACERKTNSNTIHHSDRGFQYCSKDYTNLLKKHLIDISMGEVGNCYENALAERVNGILKSEFNLDTTFMNINHALKAVNQSIKTYNELRPHMAIGLQKPNDLYAA